MSVENHNFLLRQPILSINEAGYARKQLLLSARLSHRNSVRPSFRLSVYPSVTRVDQSKTVQARVIKSSSTLVSGTVKLFHKFKRGHPERGR